MILSLQVIFLITLLCLVYENEIHPNAWAIVGFIFSGLISFWTARLLYDEDFRYNCYIYYPREMKLLDDYTNQINLKYLAFKSRLPFKGDFPDLTQPENFNRFKRELKDYFFGVDEKIEQEKLIEKKIKEDSKGIFIMHFNMKEFDTAIKDMTNYLTETDKKLQKIKVVN